MLNLLALEDLFTVVLVIRKKKRTLARVCWLTYLFIRNYCSTVGTILSLALFIHLIVFSFQRENYVLLPEHF